MVRCKMRTGTYDDYYERRQWLRDNHMAFKYFDWQEADKDGDCWYDCFRFTTEEDELLFRLRWV
jgi:hypothetical protein